MNDTLTSPATDAARRFSLSIPTIIKATLVMVVAVCLAVLATGGTYAYLNSSRPVVIAGTSGTTATLTSGTSGLIVTTAPAAFGATFYPGVTQSADFAVSATGSADLALSVSSITGQGANGLVVTVAAAPCSAGAAGIASGALGITAIAPLVYDAVNTPASIMLLCLTVTMPANAPATAVGTTTPIAITISGVQP